MSETRPRPPRPPYVVDLRKHRSYRVLSPIDRVIDDLDERIYAKQKARGVLIGDVRRRLLIDVDPETITYDVTHDVPKDLIIIAARWRENWPPWA